MNIYSIILLGYRGVHSLVKKHNVKVIRSYAVFGFAVVGECLMFGTGFLCYERGCDAETHPLQPTSQGDFRVVFFNGTNLIVIVGLANMLHDLFLIFLAGH